jgi:phosphoglycolate phosphatase
MIRQAMDEVGIGPEATVIVGDSSFDMAMGRAAGVLPIGVAWGFQPVDALREAGAALIVEDAWMLGAALDRFLAASRPAPVVPISSP